MDNDLELTVGGPLDGLRKHHGGLGMEVARRIRHGHIPLLARCERRDGRANRDRDGKNQRANQVSHLLTFRHVIWKGL